METLIILVAALAGTILASIVVEALRPEPAVPEILPWAPEIPIQYAVINGMRLRYIKAGSGPNLVLLHTLRTQLDIFQGIVPALAKRFTVYALDYPGHGYSEIPQADHEPKLFVAAVGGFLDQMKIDQATLAGVSIGGVIPLLLAAEGNPRVRRIVSINPYDYARGRGMARSAIAARVLVLCALVPVLGETFMRLRNRFVEGMIFRGGVGDPKAFPPALLEEMYVVGNRRGHYLAFLSLLRHAWKWENAHAQYGKVKVPVLVVYGERDWSTAAERDATVRAIPGARMEQVGGGGHFLSVDKPEEVARLITEFPQS
ncbi:MAG: alpha/beta hydrolase [Gammaproteobacteria bacterium]|nr:alpha/beta hydrolase [Gammaproteobacteria bacterium]